MIYFNTSDFNATTNKIFKLPIEIYLCESNMWKFFVLKSERFDFNKSQHAEEKNVQSILI